MILVDTGHIIAMFLRGDGHRPRALAWTSVIKEPLVVHEYVVVETFSYFTRGSMRDLAHNLFDAFISRDEVEFIEVDRSLHDRAMALHRDRPDKQRSLTDCVSFTVMADRAIQRALVFDAHFEQAGFDPLLRRDLP